MEGYFPQSPSVPTGCAVIRPEAGGGGFFGAQTRMITGPFSIRASPAGGRPQPRRDPSPPFPSPPPGSRRYQSPVRPLRRRRGPSQKSSPAPSGIPDRPNAGDDRCAKSPRNKPSALTPASGIRSTTDRMRRAAGERRPKGCGAPPASASASGFQRDGEEVTPEKAQGIPLVVLIVLHFAQIQHVIAPVVRLPGDALDGGEGIGQIGRKVPFSPRNLEALLGLACEMEGEVLLVPAEDVDGKGIVAHVGAGFDVSTYRHQHQGRLQGYRREGVGGKPVLSLVRVEGHHGDTGGEGAQTIAIIPKIHSFPLLMITLDHGEIPCPHYTGKNLLSSILRRSGR